MQKTSFIIYWILSLSISAFGQDAIQDPIELKELTSASSAKVEQKDFNQGVIHSPYQLFNGRMTGLGMSGLGNDPNGEFLLRVRGLSTLQIHTGPLLVVDGFITDNLLIVDPKDIEQITLLKDAASASIYGVQGGNGVLLISTKKGNDQPLSFSFNTTFGIEKPLHNIAPASSSEYKSYPGSVDLGSSTNWLDKITQNGISNVNSLAISGGSKAFSIRASINYRKANGTLTGTGFDQVNSRINMQQKALQDKLLLQFNLATTSRKSEYGFREAIKYAFNANPTMPIFDPTSTLHGGYSQTLQYENYNPVAMIEQNTNGGNEMTSTIGFNGDYEFDGKLKGLDIRASYQLQDQTDSYGSYFSRNSYYIGESRHGLARISSQNQNMQQLTTSLNYQKKVNDIGFVLTTGYRYQNSFRSSFNTEGGNFLTDAFTFYNMSAAQDFPNGIGVAASAADSYKAISWLNTAAVTYKDKYFLNITSTYSGSTRLGENNKWGLFPSIGGGIQWTKDLPVFRSLKLRASWGRAGNIPQRSNLSGSQMSPGNYTLVNGNYVPSYYISRNANPNLKWEEKSEFNLGADFTFLNDKISGSIDVFKNIITDLISPVNVPSPPNYGYVTFANLGELQNHGAEINLNVSAVKSSELSWDFNFILSRVLTKVNSLSENEYSLTYDGKLFIGNLSGDGGGSLGVNLIQEGSALGQLYGPVFNGINTNGGGTYSDLNNDGYYCYCEDDFKVLGNALPKFNFGWGNQLSYRNFDLRFLLRGARGHQKVNSYRLFHEGTGTVNYSNLVKTSYFDSNLMYAYYSSLYVENAGFIKLDNISLMYHVPSASKITISITAQNLFTLTKYTGMDPEVAYGDPILKGQTKYSINQSPLVSGIESRETYLPPRIFSAGVSFRL